jgi:hypothetical protein
MKTLNYTASLILIATLQDSDFVNKLQPTQTNTSYAKFLKGYCNHKMKFQGHEKVDLIEEVSAV